MTTSDTTQTLRVALLIDTDNINSSHAGDLLTSAAKYGNVIVRKGYGGMGQGFPWGKESMFKYAIEPVARYAYVSGKNVADIALVIDAMDLAYRKIVDVICLASSDSDFSLLAMKLRENGIKVYGFGEAKALAAFVSSCDGFIYLSGGEGGKESSTKVSPETLEKIKSAISDACDNCSDDNGWSYLGTVGHYLLRINPAFSPKNYGFSKLVDLVDNVGGFDIGRDTDTNHPRIKKTDKTAR